METETLSREEILERWEILRYKVQEQAIEQVWRQFEERKFEPILIKGWAAAQLYPNPYKRQFTDIDLIIAPERFEEAVEFLKNLRETLPVDLHKGARHLDSLSFENLFLNSVIVKCGETSIRILCPEDHLRVLCVHWLTDGGAYHEKLWDIYHAVANRPLGFDWNRLLNMVSSKRRRWIICAIGLAHKFFGLDIENTPISDEARALPKWVVKTVEREWKSDVRLQPLHIFLHDKKRLFEQIRKRIPPNPIQAMIELEGDFDKDSPSVYQFMNIFTRSMPSVKRVGKNFLKRIK